MATLLLYSRILYVFRVHGEGYALVRRLSVVDMDVDSLRQYVQTYIIFSLTQMKRYPRGYQGPGVSTTCCNPDNVLLEVFIVGSIE